MTESEMTQKETGLTEQDRKDLRKRVKFKEEMWRQDRKDRRAHMESIASAELEISNTYSSLATRKVRTWADSHKQELNDRIKNIQERISESRKSIEFLDKRIDLMEKHLLSDE